jgi:hypothetical protein
MWALVPLNTISYSLGALFLLIDRMKRVVTTWYFYVQNRVLAIGTTIQFGS